MDYSRYEKFVYVGVMVIVVIVICCGAWVVSRQKQADSVPAVTVEAKTAKTTAETKTAVETGTKLTDTASSVSTASAKKTGERVIERTIYRVITEPAEGSPKPAGSTSVVGTPQAVPVKTTTETVTEVIREAPTEETIQTSTNTTASETETKTATETVNTNTTETSETKTVTAPQISVLPQEKSSRLGIAYVSSGSTLLSYNVAKYGRAGAELAAEVDFYRKKTTAAGAGLTGDLRKTSDRYFAGGYGLYDFSDHAVKGVVGVGMRF